MERENEKRGKMVAKGEGGKKGGRSELVSTKDLSCKKREPREGPINN